MTGLAVECALKSCLAGAVKEHDFPDKQFVNEMYVHKLEKLFQLNGDLWQKLQDGMKTDGKLRVNWSTVKDWDNTGVTTLWKSWKLEHCMKPLRRPTLA